MILNELSKEIQFIIIIFGSIFIGIPLRHLKKPTSRKFVPAAIGFTMVLLFCKMQAFHSLLCFIVTASLIKLRFKYLTLASFTWLFLYLLFMGQCEHLGFKKPLDLTKTLHFVAILKLISVSCDISDFRRKCENKEKNINTPYMSSFEYEPSLFDLFSYTYCYVGLFTGPFYTFKTFIDFTNQPSTLFFKTATYKFKTNKAISMLISALLFFLIPKITNYKLLITSEYSDNPFYYRLLYPFLFLLETRFKFYSVWLGAELAFQSLNLGAYPEVTMPKPGCGPTCNFNQINSYEGKAISFDAIKNIEPLNLEKAVGVKEMMKYWNLSVKWWLRHYVLKRFPIKSLRLPVVMLTSAYLHGVQPGFYLAFLTTIMVMKAEEQIEMHVHTRLSKRLRPIYSFYAWFMSFRSFEYMSVAFYLGWKEVINIWGFLYWYIHLYSFVIIVTLKCVGLKMKSLSYHTVKNS